MTLVGRLHMVLSQGPPVLWTRLLSDGVELGSGEQIRMVPGVAQKQHAMTIREIKINYGK